MAFWCCRRRRRRCSLTLMYSIYFILFFWLYVSTNLPNKTRYRDRMKKKTTTHTQFVGYLCNISKSNDPSHVNVEKWTKEIVIIITKEKKSFDVLRHLYIHNLFFFISFLHFFTNVVEYECLCIYLYSFFCVCVCVSKLTITFGKYEHTWVKNTIVRTR